MSIRRSRAYLQALVVWGLAIAILIPSVWGFAYKFWEFIAIYRASLDGAFAIAPMVNYLLATAGFFLLLLWATRNGMFRDVERPKYWMLENEYRLDQRVPLEHASQSPYKPNDTPLP